VLRRKGKEEIQIFKEENEVFPRKARGKQVVLHKWHLWGPRTLAKPMKGSSAKESS
jgi:hypothetical protein